MKDIYTLTGAELRDFLETLAYRPFDIYRISFTTSDGGFKYKINETTWSPPLGEPLNRS
jgi:hypothetical protein